MRREIVKINHSEIEVSKKALKGKSRARKERMVSDRFRYNETTFSLFTLSDQFRSSVLVAIN